MQDKPAPLAPTRHRWVIPVIWTYILAWSLLQVFLLFPLPARSDPTGDYQPDPFVPEPRGRLVENTDPNATWFARIAVHNMRGTYNEVETHLTAHGDVLLEYLTTSPSTVGDPLSADSACVVQLPEGVIAQPPCVTIMEQEEESIFLLLFIGG
jgi:hypothetical protein